MPGNGKSSTTRNSTLFERKHSINSRESFVSGIAETPLLDREKDLNSLFGRHGPSLANVSLVGLVEAVENANDLLHTSYLTRKPEDASKVLLYREVADLATPSALFYPNTAFPVGCGLIKPTCESAGI